jgi:hypothetical protein
MTQHSVRKGINIVGNAGVEALLNGLEQIRDCRVFEPKLAVAMSNDLQKSTLQYLRFLKEKISGQNQGVGMC